MRAARGAIPSHTKARCGHLFHSGLLQIFCLTMAGILRIINHPSRRKRAGITHHTPARRPLCGTGWQAHKAEKRRRTHGQQKQHHRADERLWAGVPRRKRGTPGFRGSACATADDRRGIPRGAGIHSGGRVIFRTGAGSKSAHPAGDGAAAGERTHRAVAFVSGGVHRTGAGDRRAHRHHAICPVGCRVGHLRFSKDGVRAAPPRF